MLDTQNAIIKELPIGIFKIEMHTNIIEFYNEEALALIRGHEKEYTEPTTTLSRFAAEHNLASDIRDHNLLIKRFDYTLNVLSKPILIIPKKSVRFVLRSALIHRLLSLYLTLLT